MIAQSLRGVNGEHGKLLICSVGVRIPPGGLFYGTVADKVMHPALNRDNVGSIPTGSTEFGSVADKVMCPAFNRGDVGSIPTAPTKYQDVAQSGKSTTSGTWGSQVQILSS